MAETIRLNFKTPSDQVKTQLCTTCWLRKHPDQFEPTGMTCKDCREE